MGKSAGKIMPLPRGAYDENATYNILDMVTLDNKLWIAKKSGITGIEPSKTAPEWMMAVDGTTDVKGLETEVDAKFEEIDNTFIEVNASIASTNLEVASVKEKLVFDDTPTKGSTNLITSGTAYSMLNSAYNNDSEDGSYEHYTNSLVTNAQEQRMWSTHEQYVPNSDGTIVHRTMNGYIGTDAGAANLVAYTSLHSDNTDSSFYETRASINAYGDSINFSMKNDNPAYGGNAMLTMSTGRLVCNEDSSYDLGSSSNKFKDIYASNGTIQTSDSTEKKDIADLDAQLVSDIVMGLRPVSFKFINGTSDRTHYGLVAQEVEETVNNLGVSNQDFAPLIKTAKEDEEGNVIEGEYTYGLRYAEFVGLLIKMCQNLQNEVDDLKARLGGE